MQSKIFHIPSVNNPIFLLLLYNSFKMSDIASNISLLKNQLPSSVKLVAVSNQWM